MITKIVFAVFTTRFHFGIKLFYERKESCLTVVLVIPVAVGLPAAQQAIRVTLPMARMFVTMK
jgi:uncharacterized protein YeaC (DUF1315 family)